MKTVSAEEFDRLFDEAAVDMADYVDVSTATHPAYQTKRINVDLPRWMVDSLDQEAARIGVARQAVIKLWLDERLAGLSRPATA